MGEAEYGWLKQERAFRMQVHAPGYAAREIVPAGENLYDPQLSWLEPDGSVFFGDIGGQEQYGWDPAKGHGALGRLRPDGRIEHVVPPRNMGQYMPLCPVLAPAHFGPWGGHVFLVGQEFPGRSGASRHHLVFRHAPGSDRMEVFGVVPPAGRINDGIPGAMVTGCFGRPGTPQAGSFFVMSLMNCVIYRVSTRGEVEPFLILDEPITPRPIMPVIFTLGPSWWGDLAGEMILWGKRGITYRDEVDPRVEQAFWHVDRDGRLDPDPIPNPPSPLWSTAQAPAQFGPYGGQVFYVDEGGIDLLHVTMVDEPLPYRGRLMRIDADGRHHLFADGFQGSCTSLVFDGPRLIMGLLGKSYSTGDYHHPDGSICEIRWTG
ncbi:MAG: hypothetical protein AB7Q97_17760 [Gammaproteobacteria bacterium]